MADPGLIERLQKSRSEQKHMIVPYDTLVMDMMDEMVKPKCALSKKDVKLVITFRLETSQGDTTPCLIPGITPWHWWS